MTKSRYSAAPGRIGAIHCWLFAALLLAACGGESGDSASAGAGRRAPADVGSLYSDTGDDAGSRDSGRVVDVGQTGRDASTNDRGGPIDRVLREGAVGTVSLVIDGDTVHVTVNGWYHRVRMQGINAPECDMASTLTRDGAQFVCDDDDEYFGLGGYQLMYDIADGIEVTVHCDQAPGEACPTDAFDRYLAFLDSAEVGDISEALVRAGGAMSFTKFSSSRRAIYCEAEAEAQAAGVGMWALGTRDEVLSQMSRGTRDWYDDHDSRCASAIAQQ